MRGVPDITTTVAEIRPETPDAVTLRLDLRGASFPYRPGQYIEIDPHQFPELNEKIASLEAAKGMPESPRGFSLCSDGTDPRFLEISVKEDKAGKFPPLLTPLIVGELKPGRTIALSGPQGRYCLQDSPPALPARREGFPPSLRGERRAAEPRHDPCGARTRLAATPPPRPSEPHRSRCLLSRRVARPCEATRRPVQDQT